MIRRLSLLLLAAPALSGAAIPARSHGVLPPKPGSCVWTAVTQVGQRLEDPATHRPVPNTGSSVGFANGLYLFSYDQVEAANQSRPGDRVMLCLVRLPRHCPPGDRRGTLYTATNLRTAESWTMPDSEHQCGGA